MTKERLEELIKQGATIYAKYGHSIDLSKTDSFLENISEWYYKIEDNRLLRMQKLPHIALNQWWIKELFETKEQAEWALKIVTERTERFEPPMWEDLKVYFEEIDYKFAFATNGHCVYTFIVSVGDNGGIIELNKFSVYKPDLVCVYKAEATKENYEKACEIVRDLFKGEK